MTQRRHAGYWFHAVSALALALLTAIPALADGIFVSQQPDRSAAVALQGATVYRDVYIFFETSTPENQISSVEFFIDGTQVSKDNKSPYDLVGGNGTSAQPYDTLTLLNDGAHSMEVVLTLKDNTTLSSEAAFGVNNAYAPLAPSSALRVVAANEVVDGYLNLHGDNFDRGAPPRVAVDLVPVEVVSFGRYFMQAVLPPGLFDGDHTVNVSTDGVLAPGLTDDDHAELLVTFGAVGPEGPMGPQGPVGPEGPMGPPGPPGPGGATLTSNTFTGTQTVDGGNLDLDASTEISGNITKNGTRFLHNAGNQNTFLGIGSGNFAPAGQENTAIGYEAGTNLTSGSATTALGKGALRSNTIGSSNTAIGQNALWSNVSGSSNVGVGGSALAANVTGLGNTAVGGAALGGNASGSFNTAVGGNALSQATGNFNVAIGHQAGANNTSGSNNVYVGRAVLGLAGESNTMYLGGTQTKTFIAGVRGVTTVNADAIPVMIDSAGQLGTVSSSLRFKEDVQDMGSGSERLFRLRPVTFRYSQAAGNGTKPLQFGLVAEEVAEVFPELAVHNAQGGVDTVHYEKLNVLLLNELQKQRQRIEQLERRLDEVLRVQAAGTGPMR